MTHDWEAIMRACESKYCQQPDKTKPRTEALVFSPHMSLAIVVINKLENIKYPDFTVTFCFLPFCLIKR